MPLVTLSPARVLRDVLVGEGVVAAPAEGAVWPAYVASEPDGAGVPDNVVTVYDTAANSDGRTQNDGVHNEHYGCQIRIRSADHPTGWSKAASIRDALDQIYKDSVTVDGVTYTIHSVSRRGGVLSLGRADTGTRRRLFTINVILTGKES